MSAFSMTALSTPVKAHWPAGNAAISFPSSSPIYCCLLHVDGAERRWAIVSPPTATGRPSAGKQKRSDHPLVNTKSQGEVAHPHRSPRLATTTQINTLSTTNRTATHHRHHMMLLTLPALCIAVEVDYCIDLICAIVDRGHNPPPPACSAVALASQSSIGVHSCLLLGLTFLSQPMSGSICTNNCTKAGVQDTELVACP